MADLGKMSRNALACFRALYFPLALLEVGWVLLWFPGSSLDHVTHNRVVWRPSMWHSFGSRINLRSEKTSWFLQRQYPVPQQKCKYDISLLLFHVCRNSVLQGSGGGGQLETASRLSLQGGWQIIVVLWIETGDGFSVYIFIFLHFPTSVRRTCITSVFW